MLVASNTLTNAGATQSTVLDECRLLAQTWAPVLRALGNPERLLIVLWLAGTTSTVRDLEKVTGLSQSLVSYHLRALRESGLVTAIAVGRSNRYQLAHPDLDKLATLMGNLDAPASASESAAPDH
jgi:DNA-binding transcriptional ArsR family regulator